MKRPFAPSAHLTPDLARVEAYWRSLLRGSAQIPFWDDFDPSKLPDLRDRQFLVGVYARPERYRFDLVGGALTKASGHELEGLFADETPPAWPFEYLIAQCAATTEAGAPTLHRAEGDRPYSRLILPMWGDGRLSMLAGVIEPG